MGRDMGIVVDCGIIFCYTFSSSISFLNNISACFSFFGVDGWPPSVSYLIFK